MKLFSEEWTKTLGEKLNSGKDFLSAAQDLSWSVVLSVTEDSPEKSIFINFENGKCKSAGDASPADLESTEFIIAASKNSWENLLTGKLDPMMAVMTKKLELKKGNIGGLMKYIEAAKELFKSAKQITTEF
jgi:putative sterol carrier protein